MISIRVNILLDVYATWIEDDGFLNNSRGGKQRYLLKEKDSIRN